MGCDVLYIIFSLLQPTSTPSPPLPPPPTISWVMVGEVVETFIQKVYIGGTDETAFFGLELAL